MVLKVEKGSVIRLFINSEGRYDFHGAVIELNENEVVLRPQLFVLKKGTHGGSYYVHDFVHNLTVDDPYRPPIHVYRKIIIGWAYILFPSTSDGTNYCGWYPGEEELGEFEDEAIHRYDPRDGVCHGDYTFLEI